MEEHEFFTQSETSKPAVLSCPFCKQSAEYKLKWIVRQKRDRLPGRADERDRARFQKAQSYMVLCDDRLMCQNPRCRKRFEISGIKTMAFI